MSKLEGHDDLLKEAARKLMRTIRQEYPTQAEAWIRDRFWLAVSKYVGELTREEWDIVNSALKEQTGHA